jgi:C4-dicarboxylate transporter DctM subunit
MDWYTSLFVVIVMLVGLLLLGVWIPVAIGVAGIILLLMTTGSADSLGVLGTVAYNNVNSFVLTAIPLFVLMGELVLRSGLMSRFYRALSLWVNWLPGGLLHTNVIACAVMAAVTGSSVATAGTVGSSAIPELRAKGYTNKLLFGTIAAGGTLGILIPPSIVMIVYGALTQESVAALFMAGLLPGVLLAVAFSVYVLVYALTHRSLFEGVVREEVSWTERIRSLVDVVPILALMAGVVGGIYAGYMTPTEAGGVGVILSLAIIACYRELRVGRLRSAVVETINLSTMVIFIIVGAAILTYGLSRAGITGALTTAVGDMQVSRYVLLLFICVLFIVMGMFIDGISMMYLALPLLIPIVAAAGFNLIWFGVVVTILIEIGQITPPMGLNLFVLKGIDRSTDLAVIVKDAVPFMLILLGMIALITVFPELALWLPENS